MSLAWFDDLADAKDYFINERLETEHWDALDDAQMTKVLKMAYNRIYHNPNYDVPTYSEATAAQLALLKIVSGEMAYYLALHLSDEDRRKGLQAQGVTDAGIVKESYDKDSLMTVPIPAYIDALLNDYKSESAFHMIDIDRDEDESVDTKVDDF